MSSATVQTVRLGIFFLILFSGAGSFLIIVTYIYEQKGLNAIGPTILAIDYLTFIFSSIIAASSRWKLKHQIILAGVGYTFNLSTGVFVSFIDDVYLKFIIVSIGAMVMGLSAGFLFMSQARYMHLLCIQKGIQKDKGKYFGLFSTIFGLFNIFGGLITGFGIGFFSTEIYFLILTGIGIISIIYSFTLTDIQKHQIKAQQQQAKFNIKQSLKKVFRYYPKITSIIPMFILHGLSLAMFTSEITHLIPNSVHQDDLNRYAGFCRMSLGLGAAAGGYLTGAIGDKFGAKISGVFGIATYLLGLILTVVTLVVQEFWMTLITSFWWGFIAFYTFCWATLICSRNFGGDPQAFSITRQIQDLTFFLFQLIIIFTNNDINLYVLSGVMAVFAIPALILLRKVPEEKIMNVDSTVERTEKETMLEK